MMTVVKLTRWNGFAIDLQAMPASVALDSAADNRVPAASDPRYRGPMTGAAMFRSSVISDHEKWIRENPAATIGELCERLKTMLSQCRDIAAEHAGRIEDYTAAIPQPLRSELALWDTSAESCTFASRADSLAEMVEMAAELSQAVGGDYSLKRLAKEVAAKRQLMA